jgi:hypothetical protein
VDAGLGNDELHMDDGAADEPIVCGGPGDDDKAIVDFPEDTNQDLQDDCEQLTLIA